MMEQVISGRQPQKTQQITVTGSGGEVNTIAADGQMGLVTITPGHVSTVNSTSTPLGIDGVFTGTKESVVNHGVLVVSVYSDVASATGGLSAQFSTDGVNWDNADTYTIAAATAKTFSFQTSAKWFRIVYTNGSTGQTAFRLQTVLKPYYVKPSSHRVGDVIAADDDAELVKSVLSAALPSGIFAPINATLSGNLKVANVESGLSIAKGDVTGSTFIHKFGNAPDFDIGDGYVDIWDGANDGGINQMSYTYSTTADIDSLSSSNNGDTQDIEVQGLDSNYDLVTQTITLTGQTRKALDTSLIRIFRMKNVGSTDLAGQLYCYVNTAILTGVPTDKTKIRALINNGNNQTLMSLYTIPNGKTGYMRDWYASLSAKKTAAVSIELFARPFGQVFQLKHISDLNSTGSSYIQHKYEEPEVFNAKTDVVMRAATSVDANGVAAGFDLVLVDN